MTIMRLLARPVMICKLVSEYRWIHVGYRWSNGKHKAVYRQINMSYWDDQA